MAPGRPILATALAVASLASAACGSSARSAGTLPKVTSTTAALPSDVVVAADAHVVAWGESNGVRWFFSHEVGRDHLGACSEFDSDPPLRDIFKPITGTDTEIGYGDFSCTSSPPKLAANPQDVFLHPPIVVVEAARSDDGTFSALAGETAPGVDAVEAHYSDGTVEPIAIGSSHVFVAIGKPPTRPPRLVVRFKGKTITCHPNEIGGGYNCDPQSMG